MKVTQATTADAASSKSSSSLMMQNKNMNPYDKNLSTHRRNAKGGRKMPRNSSNNGNGYHTNTPVTVNMMDTDHCSIEPVIEEDEDSGYDYDDEINDAIDRKPSKSKQSTKNKKKKNSMWTPRTAILDTMDESSLVSPPCPVLLFNNSNVGITSPLTPFEGNTLSVVSESQNEQQPIQQQQPSQQKRLKRSSPKKKKKARRNSGHQRGFNSTPNFSMSDGSLSICGSSNKLMTPLQLAPLGNSMIPEEEDPTAPSDEEDFNERMDLEQPGRLVPTWKSTGVVTPSNLMSPLTVSWSYDDDDDDTNASPSFTAATNLSTARSSMSPEQYVAALELSRSAVKPKQYSNFQKLKLQVALHKQHSQKQAVSIKKQDRAADVQAYRQLYHTFQEMQQELQQQQQETVNAAALAQSEAESVSVTTESLDIDKSKHKDKKKTPASAPQVRPMKRTNSFDLKNSNTWYFDFQAPELHLEQSIAGSTVNVTAANTVAAIAADTDFADDNDSDSDDCSIVSRQSGLSLLSEATMDAQRRLFAEKRRERRRKKAGATSGAKSVTSARFSSLPTATLASTVTTARRDYGPVRRLSKSMEPESTTVPLTDMDISFVQSLEDASSPYKQQHAQPQDDASMVSDMGDDCSIASNNTTNSNNDYRVPRRVRRSYNPDDAEVSRSPVKMSFSFDEGAMAAVAVLRSNSNAASPNNLGPGMGATDQEQPQSRISVMGVAGASPLPHSQLMNRFDEVGASSPATKVVTSHVKSSPMAAATTPVGEMTTMTTAPNTLESMDLNRNQISESLMPGASIPIKDRAALDFLPRVQNDATTIKSSSAAAALDLLPRVQNDATTTADGRMDAQLPTAAPVTPDKNSALPGIAKLKTAALLADAGNAYCDTLLENDGSNLPPSTPAGASDSPAVVSPDWAQIIVESPIMVTTKNISSPVSPDSPQEDSFWEINTKGPESISKEQSEVRNKASPDKVKLVTDEEPLCSPVDPITAMSTEAFLRMAEDSKLGRYEYKSEFSSNESDSGASLLLAEEVEAQVKDVLTKYREYGDIYVSGAKAESLSESESDELPRIISPERNSASH